MKTAIVFARMNTKEFDADELNLITLAQEYSDENKARELLERLLWPHGAVCPHCKNDGKDRAVSICQSMPMNLRSVGTRAS